MGWLIVKYLLSAGVIVAVSEIAKQNGKLGALITALPLIAFSALIWLYLEGGSSEKIGNYAWYTFWYVLPTLPMFLTFPYLLSRIGFWTTIASSVVITMGCFVVFAFILKRFGIELWQ